MADLNISVDMAQLVALNKEMMRTSSTYNVATRQLETFQRGAQRSAGSMNRMGMVTQQAGYQVGDFLVQIQSGTNAFVAFGQQATQLAGLMTTFGGKFIAIGTALGILIPLATALGAAWMRTAEDTNVAEEAIRSVEEALKSVQRTTEDMRLKGIAELMGISTEEVTLAERIAAAEKERQAANASIAEIKKTVIALEGQYNLTAAIDLRRQQNKQASLEEELKSINEKLAKLKAQQIAEQINAAMLAKQEAIYVRLLQTQTRSVGISKEMAKAIDEGRIKAEGVKAAIDKFANTTVKVGVNFQASFTGFTGQAAEWAGGLYNEMKSLAGNPSYMPSSPRPMANGLGIDGDLGPVGSGGGGGGGGGNARLESLISELQTEQETLAIWYEESQTALQAASDAELTILGGKHDAMLRLTEEYVKRKGEIEEMGNKYSLESALGGAAEIFGAMGAFNKKALKAAAIFSAGQALISTYEGAAKELKKGTFGFASAAAVIAKGIGFVAAIKSAGNGASSVSTGGGGGGVGTSTVAPPAAPATPQTVYIDSLTPDSLYSGQTLINLFDALYDENDKRGKVFVVGR